MHTRDGEPKPIWSCEPAVRYPFQAAQNIAGKYTVERVDEYTKARPYISVTQGEMLVDDFSSVDDTIEIARNNFDLTRTRSR